MNSITEHKIFTRFTIGRGCRSTAMIGLRFTALVPKDTSITRPHTDLANPSL